MKHSFPFQYIPNFTVISLLVGTLSGCASQPDTTPSTEAENAQSTAATKELNATSQGANTPFSVNNGVIFYRRKTQSDYIEMVMHIGDDDLVDYDITLANLPEAKEQLPADTPADQPVSDTKLADRSFLIAQSYFLEGRYRRALLEITRSIQADNSAALSWALKGSIHYQLNELGKARDAWQKALSLDDSIEGVAEKLQEIGP